jgi:hypothetical protein
MEVAESIDMAVLLKGCLAKMDQMEATFIENCFLAEPRVTFKVFAEDQGLKPKAFAEFRSRAFRRLKEELAGKNVRSMWDLE